MATTENEFPAETGVAVEEGAINTADEVESNNQNDASPIQSNGDSENAEELNGNDTTNGETHEESPQSPDEPAEDRPLFHLVFENDESFDELATTISSRIREALAALKKTVSVSVDKANRRIEFAEANGDIFMVDTLPTDKVNRSEVPSYKSVVEALKQMSATNKKDDKPKGGGCWNCGGDHNMRECKEPMNRENVSRARQAFQRTKTERYHLDADNKFAQYQPGSISEGLRDALGLRKRELPLYIYKMRLLGYPPGWLEEAKVTRSGLTLFNSENASVPDLAAEDGEVDKITFDSKQFISYPGFNAVVPEGYIDDTSYYRVPPMQYQHSREGLIQSLQGNLARSYKRKKLKLSADSPSIETAVVVEVDMDVESDGEADSPVEFVLPRPTADDEADTPASPSTDDIAALEEHKQKLLQQLANDNSASNSNDSHLMEKLDDATDVTETDGGIDAAMPDDDARPSTPTTGRSREVLDGTPLLKTSSPFGSLPTGDKWSAGVSDVIDFENLPDAVGAYKRLRGLISTVRSVVQQINDQNDAEDDDDEDL